MSVVAVKVGKDKIEFAADSIAVRGATSTKIVKLSEINKMIIGGVGTAEETSLLFMFAKTHSPLDNTEKSVLEFFYEFCKWKNGLNLPFTMNNSYLFGFGGKAFSIENLLIEEIKDYEAIGAGMDYALSALYLKHTAKEAVKVACELSCYVAEPIVSLTMEVANEQV